MYVPLLCRVKREEKYPGEVPGVSKIKTTVVTCVAIDVGDDWLQYVAHDDTRIPGGEVVDVFLLKPAQR